ncbi:hypothetical protein [Brucella anthropi]|uniref:hypothetical protein n=1 Tax=Brucella anthropi TaxID=529 RepID=UPI00384FB39A
MVLRILQADPNLVQAAEGLNIDLPVLAYIGVDGDHIVGSGGLAWGQGKCWLWLTLQNGKPEYARPIVRMVDRLKRKAAQLGETEIYTPRDKQFATSERLLRFLGFELSEAHGEQEIWVHKWQH